MEAETGVMWPQAKNTCSHQQLKEIWKDSTLETLGGMEPYQHFYFGLLASRTVRE